MTDKEKIEMLESILVAEGLLDDFDITASQMDDTINMDKATDIISQSAEFGKFLEQCYIKVHKYNPNTYYSSSLKRDREKNYMSKTGNDICLHLIYPLYIDPSTLKMLGEVLPIMPNQIDVSEGTYQSEQNFYIDDIDNVNPSTTFKRIVAGTTTIRDARAITDMDFFVNTPYEDNSIFMVDSFHQSLKMERCNIWFNFDPSKGAPTASLNILSKMLFRCPAIPTLSNVSTNARCLGFYDDVLFSNKRNQKFFDLFEWNTSWTAPDGKTIIMKKFEDLEKIFDIGHKALKKYLDDCERQNLSRSSYSRGAGPKAKPVLTTPIALTKNAKLSDVIDLSGFSNLSIVMFSNGELTIEFNRKDKYSDSWPTKTDISLGQTLDGWFVYICRDKAANKHRSDFAGW